MKNKIRSAPLPFVSLNMAMSADGKIATANRVVSSFGSRLDHERLLELRAHADAVMAGARTVDANPVDLGPGPARFRAERVQRGLAEYNLRIVVSGSGSIDPQARIFTKRFSPIIILTTEKVSKPKLRQLQALADDVYGCGEDEIDFPEALAWLRSKWKVKRLLCEGGGRLNDALFRAGVVRRVNLTLCPKIFGGSQAPTIADGEGFPSLAQAARLRLVSLRRKGDEMFLSYNVER